MMEHRNEMGLAPICTFLSLLRQLTFTSNHNIIVLPGNQVSMQVLNEADLEYQKPPVTHVTAATTVAHN
jgi:hypothetical protein